MTTPFYQTLHTWQDGASEWREKCPDCGHMNYQHIKPCYTKGVKRIKKCWYCKRVTWIIHILVKE